jgi:hypothetical protein
VKFSHAIYNTKNIIDYVHIINKKVNPPVEVVYDTSPRTTTRAARGDSLIVGTRALHAQIA